MAWDVLTGVGCFVLGDKNRMRCFVQGGKTFLDVLSKVSKNGMGYFVPGCFVRLPNLIAIFKIMFSLTFVSHHNKECLMLYSVQLKNMYSHLNSSLKLSDIVRGLSCQH